MCNRSDSGVTQCCYKCRRASWTCASCGANFTRKYNAERHIRNVHSGEGEVVHAIGNSGLVLESTMPTFFRSSPFTRSNFFSSGRKARQLLDEQTEAELKKIIALINQNGSYSFVNLAGHVCSDCLKIVLEGEITNSRQLVTIPRHECEPSWLFDQPFLLNHSHLAEKYLENKIARIIVNILCRHGEESVSIYSDEEKDIQADIDKNYVKINTSEFPWCTSFYEGHPLHVKKEDALKFLSITKRTSAKCRVFHGKIEKLFLIEIL